MSLDVVFIDIGGVIYDDRTYRRAVLRGLRDLGATMSEEEYDAAYDDLRRAQAGSFRDALAERFLSADVGRETVTRAVAPHWSNPPDALHDDVRPCLDDLVAAGYRLGVIANQPSEVRRAMVRDRLTHYFGFLGVSDDLGLEKPDPRIFAHAVEVVGAEPSMCAMVGDRLDHDVRPAKAAGMRAVWVLRGEAPERPTSAQLAEPDAWVRTLADLPAALEAIA
ncbi:MAG TPA: HAD-IA family hydrolase [Actinomycetota bacterium]|nr:HAD-IA family hydrolase [Actinomycetota bacterium]